MTNTPTINPAAVITAADAERIRELHAQGRRMRDLATDYRVSRTTISRTLRLQLHVPASVRVVPVVLSRRLHALAALRAVEAGGSVPTFLSTLIQESLEPKGADA